MDLDVLIVEDDFIIQLFIENVITNIGCKVVGSTQNRYDTIELIKNKKPDLVLMDVGILGGEDGIETAERINEEYNIPIVFITGNSDPVTLNRAMATNPVLILKKPIDELMLEKKLLEICNELSLKKRAGKLPTDQKK